MREKLNPNLINAMTQIAQGYMTESEEEGEIEHDARKQVYIETRIKEIVDIIASDVATAPENEKKSVSVNNLEVKSDVSVAMKDSVKARDEDAHKDDRVRREKNRANSVSESASIPNDQVRDKEKKDRIREDDVADKKMSANRARKSPEGDETTKKRSREPRLDHDSKENRITNNSGSRRKSKSPSRRKSKSPTRRNSQSPNNQKNRSPVRRKSKSPALKKNRSPVRTKTRSPVRIELKSPSRRRSKSPIPRKSQSQTRRISRSPNRSVNPDWL